MEEEIEKIVENEIYKTINAKVNNDIITSDILQEEVLIANKLKIIQMRIGKLWELIAMIFDWEKVYSIDLVNRKTLQAVELKNADNTDNSSSRSRNHQKLLDFQHENPDFEIIYACINCNCSKPTDKYLDNGIRYMSGKFALKLLYGKYYKYIIETIRRTVKETFEK